MLEERRKTMPWYCNLLILPFVSPSVPEHLRGWYLVLVDLGVSMQSNYRCNIEAFQNIRVMWLDCLARRLCGRVFGSS